MWEDSKEVELVILCDISEVETMAFCDQLNTGHERAESKRTLL